MVRTRLRFLDNGEILQEADMNSGEPMYPLLECNIKLIEGKIQQEIIHWQSGLFHNISEAYESRYKKGNSSNAKGGKGHIYQT